MNKLDASGFRYNQNIFINSADRISGTNENFIVQLQDKSPGFKKDVGVVSVIIPYTYYNINNNNNAMGLSISGHNYPVSLTNGNYTSSSFTSMLNTQLGVSAGITFSSSISATTGLLGITANNSNPSFGITGYPWLGTTQTTTLYNSVGSALTLPVPINLSGTPYIDVRADLPLSSVNSKDFNRYLLARVPINTTPFNSIFYTNDNFNYVNTQTENINSLQLSLFDADGNQMDLNQHTWQIVLEVSSNNA